MDGNISLGLASVRSLQRVPDSCMPGKRVHLADFFSLSILPLLSAKHSIDEAGRDFQHHVLRPHEASSSNRAAGPKSHPFFITVYFPVDSKRIF